MAGLTNLVSLTITTGPAAILNQSLLELTSESGLMFQAMECGLAVITSQPDEEYTNAEYHIELADTADKQNSKMSSRFIEDCFTTLSYDSFFFVKESSLKISSQN